MPTELEIAQQQLADVRTAICGVLSIGQSHSVAGRTFTKADLRELRRMESDLLTRISRLQRGGIRVQRVYPLG